MRAGLPDAKPHPPLGRLSVLGMSLRLRSRLRTELCLPELCFPNNTKPKLL